MTRLLGRLRVLILKHELLIFVCLGIILLRLPNLFEPYWYGDEGIYLTVGQAMRRGIPLYQGIIDHKTPLIYLLAFLVGNLFWFKVSLILVSLISTWLFYLLTHQFFRHPLPRLLTLLLFTLTTTLPAFEGNILNGEILLMPFILTAIYLFWRHFPPPLSSARSLLTALKTFPLFLPFLIGLLFGLALLTKVPSVLDFVGLGVFLLFFVPFAFVPSVRLSYLRFGFSLIAGALVTVGLSVCYFWLHGNLKYYLDLGLLYNFRYIQAWGTPFTHPLAIFMASMLGRLILVSGLLFILFLFRRRFSLTFNFVVIWFLFTFFACLLSLRPYPHYFIQTLPPLTLLFGFLFQTRRHYRLVTLGLFLLAFLILRSLRFDTYPVIPYYQNFLSFIFNRQSTNAYFARFDANVPGTYTLAHWLQTHTDPSEPIFIWGNEPMLYSLANRSPSVRYTVAFHIESFNAYNEVMTALSTQPPPYILDIYQNQNSFPELYQFLAANYLSLGHLDRAHLYRYFPH